MLNFASICISEQTTKFPKTLANQGISGQKGVNQNYDKSLIRLPRQYLPESDGGTDFKRSGGTA